MLPDSVSLCALAQSYQTVKQELWLWKTKSSDISKVIDQASSHIIPAINIMEKPTQWPYHPSHLNKKSFVVPAGLTRFLTGLLAGHPEQKCTSQRIQTLTDSISQDIIYAVSGGQHKPPKHILLSYGVKTLTGNV